MSKISPPDAFFDPINMEQMAVPYLHKACGNSVDEASLKAWFAICDTKGNPKTCPRCNVAVVGMKDFTLNRDLQEAIEQFPEMGIRTVATSPQPKPTPKPSHINLSLSLFGSQAKELIKQQNRWLWDTHINKDATKEVAVDATRHFVVILKSKQWRVYRMQGQGGAIRENPDKNAALRNIPV